MKPYKCGNDGFLVIQFFAIKQYQNLRFMKVVYKSLEKIRMNRTGLAIERFAASED
jgi:hypothetical protein